MPQISLKKTLLAILSLCSATVGFSWAVAAQYNSKNEEYAAWLDAIVIEDSYGWAVNSYHKGSMRVVSVRDTETSTGLPARIVRGEYNYSSLFSADLTGWIEAYIIEDKLDSIRYHDFPNTWRTADTYESVRRRQREMDDRVRREKECANMNPYGQYCDH